VPGWALPAYIIHAINNLPSNDPMTIPAIEPLEMQSALLEICEGKLVSEAIPKENAVTVV
jgi:hypothetical protein